jgi:microcystin-dependent protein
MTVHRNLTGADLHEPKGADTALSGQVYVANGSGGGVWTDAASIITNSAFTTGDTKLTLKTTADTGWIMGAAGSIGDGSSGATQRANADTSALFTLLWNNFNNTLCPVSGGRGASAAADFAAHKTITLPDMWQRVIGIVGSYNGAGQSSRTLGQVVGTETHTLVAGEMPNHNHTLTDPGHVHIFAQNPVVTGTSTNSVSGPGSFSNGVTGGVSNSLATATTGISIAAAGGGGAHNNMQPTVFINIMIKL